MASHFARFITRHVVLAFPLLSLPAMSSARAATLGGVVVLRNGTWDAVQVEIRIGPSTACDAYASIAVRTLKRGEAWAVVVANGTVCWRREAIPGAQQLTWTSWQANAIPATGVSDVAL